MDIVLFLIIVILLVWGVSRATDALSRWEKAPRASTPDIFLVKKENGELWWVSQDDFGSLPNYDLWTNLKRVRLDRETALKALGKHQPHRNSLHRELAA